MKTAIVLKELHADELYFRRNPIQADRRGTVMALNPLFTRRVRSAENNERLFFVTLSVQIESNDSQPKPFELRVSLTGAFELSEPTRDGYAEEAAKATNAMYPYVRAAVTSLTANAFVPPVVLPTLAAPLFPEDRQESEEPQGPVS